MTTTEAIAAVRSGARCETSTTIHGLTPPTNASHPACLSGYFVHGWRTVACDGTTDVVECSRCGRQELATCDFDEEFA